MVQAVPSKLHGTEVRVRVTLAEGVARAAGEEAVQGVLGQYALHYVVEIA